MSGHVATRTIIVITDLQEQRVLAYTLYRLDQKRGKLRLDVQHAVQRLEGYVFVLVSKSGIIIGENLVGTL